MAKLKRWFRKDKRRLEELDQTTCLNCRQVYQGFYCPNCGQSTSEFDRPFGFVFYDFLGNFLAFDSRFFHTYRDLIFKPGFLTKEFFKGRRARYAPPFRGYIFMSFVLFLLLQIMTTRSLNSALEYSLDSDPEVAAAADSLVAMASDSLVVELPTATEDSSSFAGVELDELLTADNVRGSMRSLADQLEENAKTEEDPGDRRRMVQFVDTLRSPEQLIARMLKYLSYAFFVLLPVFALLLKLFYVRRKVFYIRHLVFSVHLHSFIFFLLSLVVGVNLLFPGKIGVFSLWLLLLVPVYIYIAMKKFYQQGYFKTLVKFVVLGGFYNLLLLFLFVTVFINALGVL